MTDCFRVQTSYSQNWPYETSDTVEDKNKLEIWGRAQHEAARRPMSDLKYILGVCKVCKDFRGQHRPKGRIIVS